MKFRSQATGETKDMESREEVRELAEALSLYRSAMTHIAERSTAHPRLAVQRTAAPFRLRLLLGPVLGAGFAAGILLPVYAHLRHQHAVTLPSEKGGSAEFASARTSVDDTALMNQIDINLSATVPDALAPLADLSAQASTQSAVPEKKQ